VTLWPEGTPATARDELAFRLAGPTRKPPDVHAASRPIMSRPAVPTHTGRTLTRLIPILSLSRVPEGGHPVPSALIGMHPDSPPETYPNPGAAQTWIMTRISGP